MGRVSHLLQDMTSAPHVLWQKVWYSHYNYENYWADEWQSWWNTIGSGVTGGPLEPTDSLPSRATMWHDQFSKDRITYRWNQTKANTVNGYIDTVAWIAYFRSSVWGEITDDDDNDAPQYTTPTNADGTYVGAKSNALRTMFGAGNIDYTWIGLGGYHYWTINDRLGNNHHFESEDLIDHWWPAEGDFPDGHYEEGSKDRYTGRFYFSRPADTWPRYYPDGTATTKSLAYYYGTCLFPLTIQYNAGLLGLAHPSVTVRTSPPDKGLDIYVDGTTYTNSQTFRWPIKSQHTIEAPSTQTGSDGKGYTFKSWSDGGGRVHTIRPNMSYIYTAVYESAPAPPAPTQVSPLNGETGVSLTPTLKWNSVPGADDYGLYVSEPPYGERHLVFDSTEDYGPIDGTSFTLPSGRLSYGVTYYWNMNSHNSAGWGSYSTPSWRFTTTSPTVQYSITASAGANGSISPSGTIVKNAGESQQFTAMPNTSYTVDTWYLDGSAEQTGGTTYTLNNIQSDHSVHVTFKSVPPQYTISASAGANGSISPSGTIAKNAGESQEFTVTPNTNYAVDQWYLDGNSVKTGGNTYTLSNIQSDYNVYVTFKYVSAQYTVTASAGANGSISPSGTIVKNAGESQQFTAMPNTDYTVDTWYLDGSADQTGCTTYTLNNIQSDHAVYVTFKTIPPITVYADFCEMAQWLASQQQGNGGVQEAEDNPTAITDNTAESIWTWSRYAELTGDYMSYLPNINNAWDFCYANPSWEEFCSDWLGQRYFCYYTVYNVGWGLLAEMKHREVYEGRPGYIDHTWYGEQCANTLVNYTPGTGSTIDALCLGLAAGALHQYGVNVSNSTYCQRAAELGNNVRQWLEADTSRFSSETWAVSAGIAIWGVLNSYFQENPGGDAWAQEFAAYMPTDAHDGLNNDYQYGHDGWYAWGHYAVSKAIDSADYFDNYRNIVDYLLSVDGDGDGGIPQGSTDTDNQDHAWVTNVTAFALNLGLVEAPIGDFCGPDFGPADGYVDVWDLMQFADQWHTRTGDSNWDSKFDLTGPDFEDIDGYIDVWDLMVFADNWHEGQKP